ncbi:GAF domain-containing sensor histidine kinase [Halopiger goleimassiliensis]|uniref:GAF domain-containing sensor histidine kinase n=1 Tax=Halopiger goleimassiliensis TaxID=1293048 RepID=UPI0009DC1EA9|nr:GAF domain-containing sensor histidine kinase [Halopiger goleimassiliensis]
MTRRDTRDGSLDGRGASPQRSFHVLYVDSDCDRCARIDDALDPAYRVTTVESFAGARVDSFEDVDAVVVGEDLSAHGGDAVLRSLEDDGSTRPVLAFGPEPDADALRTLLEFEHADLLVRSGDDLASTDLERLRERLEEYYQRSISDVRETVLEIASSLMGAAPDEIDVEIEWGLQLIGNRLDADRCLVFTLEDGVFERTHQWDHRGSRRDDDGQIPANSFPGYDSLQAFDPYAVPGNDGVDVEVPEGFVGSIVQTVHDDRPADARPATRRYLQNRNLESLLAVPIVIDWELRGAIVVEQDTRRPWPVSLQQQVTTLGELIGHTLERERRRRELARQNERLERFSSVVSHDLRNPLNVLTGYAELVEETGDPDYIDDVLVSARRMETMIDDLLALARDGRDLDEREHVVLADVVEQAWNGVRTDDATLETRDLGSVEGDPARLRRLFENLFRNAVEHAGPAVTVRVEGTDDGFAVEDDGPGIPPDEREQVFNEGVTMGGGTGLGLAIVDTITTAHDWEVTVETGDLGGARFAFRTDTGATFGSGQ